MIDGMPSATGLWTALVDEETCADIEANAKLMPSGRPSQVVTVLVIDTDGYPDQRPRVAWSAPNVLLVTVPAKSELQVLKRQVGDVRVDLKYEPTYATRTAWLKQDGLQPDPLEAP